MSNLKEAILNKVVKPEMKKQSSGTIGTILKYSQRTNKADIRYIHPSSNTESIAEGVKVQLSGGMCTAGPFPGDMVAISFHENNPTLPVITNIIDNEFEENTFEGRYKHKKQGSFYPFKPEDNINASSYEDIKEKPNIENYNNKKKDSKSIYNSGRSPIDLVQKKLEVVDKFHEAEIGFVHPFNGSSVHIRDNGIVDLFAETNSGIRIDPIEQSISQYSNMLRMKANDLLATIYNNATYNVVNKIELNSKNEIVINGKNKIRINSDGSLDLVTKGKMDIKADSLDLNISGGINMKSGSTMSFNAPRYDFK